MSRIGLRSPAHRAGESAPRVQFELNARVPGEQLDKSSMDSVLADGQSQALFERPCRPSETPDGQARFETETRLTAIR